jgi:L-alanine-DL-glutamate epimerase-like enolase superfamily enzyme
MVVRVHTDAGIVGLGETVDKIPGAKGALHGTIAPLVLGQDPLDIEGLWRFVMDNIMYHGYAGAEVRALSAVEVALWDILGKRYGAPLYHLLGGKTRSCVPTYNTCIGFGPVQDYAAWHTDAGALAKSLMADGVHAMKIWPFDPFSEASFGQYIGLKDIEAGLKPVRQIREAVGDAMEIGSSAIFAGTGRASTHRAGAGAVSHPVLEDVLPPVYPDEIKLVAGRTSIPIIGSELLLTRWQLREWLEKHVSQIVMTDPVWNGGIAETRKIAALAETFGVPVVLHNIAGPICHAAAMHLGAHIPNLFFVESVRALYQTYFPVISDLTVTASGSTLAVPEGPGLGVTLRPEMLERLT